MKLPLDISYRGMEKSAAIDELIHKKAAKLEQVCNQINSLRVALEVDHKRQRSTMSFRVRLDFTVPPGHELCVKRESTGQNANDDLYLLVRETFDAAKRKASKLNQKQGGRVKPHPEHEVQAVVSKLFPGEDYGFVRTLNERDVYFHRNSVVYGDFEDLTVGDGVALEVTQGEKGLQATSIRLIESRTRPEA
ncbi:HPF/RaiA family ribosome-associated protein [Desulfovibrio inopinatus]|uniref:HPF/RaiA family ribosome-associated protein n=1 Tax=Desulfovibrio inopinatus TaxID=102109 RepID=UPI0003F71791|nr:HPF/RaiA family ribosome-associated protein [Desulfovibrio inopinatus]